MEASKSMDIFTATPPTAASGNDNDMLNPRPIDFMRAPALVIALLALLSPAIKAASLRVNIA
jgi:hypothetical protein